MTTQPDDNIELSIVMPCLNEAETLKTCIDKAMGYLKKSGIKGEVVIGDNGSTDGSQQIARDAGARVVDVPRRGYGAALMGAIEGSRGKYVIMGDSDDSYDFSSLDLHVAKLREGYDLVMGNRFKGGVKPGAMPFLHRYLGNPVLSFIGRLFFPSKIGDFHCGLRGFRQDIVQVLGLQTTGMEFASEMVVKSTLFKLKVCEVPTVLSPDGRSRPPHLRTWRDGWRHLRFLLIYSPRWLYLIPGLLLMIIGLVLGAAVTHGPKTIGAATFDTNTILYCGTFVIIGFQAVIFGFLTRVYGMQNGFLPKRPFLERLTQKATLEWGLVTGILLFLVGLAGSIYAVLQWDQSGFTQLEYPKILRVVIPSVVSIIVGFQIIFAAFFLSVLAINRK
ncbi:MAG: dolichol-p-glucose synthetase [Deltaproteobacteria bacterium]|nr:dolichol-p-glucose synthetase [Deltaproteobacteria bacterium]